MIDAIGPFFRSKMRFGTKPKGFCWSGGFTIGPWSRNSSQVSDCVSHFSNLLYVYQVLKLPRLFTRLPNSRRRLSEAAFSLSKLAIIGLSSRQNTQLLWLASGILFGKPAAWAY